MKSLSQKTLHTSVWSVIESNITMHVGRALIAAENNPPAHQVGRFAEQHSSQHEVMPKDDFASVLSWAQDNPNFCHEITAHPEPLLIIGSQQQLYDLGRFTVGGHAQQITIDSTFNLGNFYVTPITYKNLFLENDHSTNACFCGPLLIHYKKTQSTYSHLFRLLTVLVSDITNLAAYGTDGELELIKALELSFPDAEALRCFLHIDKISSKNVKLLVYYASIKLLSNA